MKSFKSRRIAIAFAISMASTISPKALCQSQASPATPKQKFVLHAQKMHALQNTFNRIFVLTDRPNQFLGEPSVAKLDLPDESDDFDYFAIAIPFNVPMIKNNLPIHYRFVRLDGRLKVFAQEPGLGGPATYSPMRILSIYPTNLSLDANMESTHELEETIQPSWNGASAGSIRNLNKDVLSYKFQMPTMAGITAPQGSKPGEENYGKLSEIRWTLYPAKRQRIILGDKLGLAIIAVTKVEGAAEAKKNGADLPPDTRLLALDAHLRYALNVSPPLITSNFEESWQVPLDKAGSLDQLLAAHALDFPSSDVSKLLKTTFGSSSPAKKMSVKPIGDSRAVVFDENSGAVKEITREGLTPLHEFSRSWETQLVGGAIYKVSSTKCEHDLVTFQCRTLLQKGSQALSGASLKISNSKTTTPPQIVYLHLENIKSVTSAQDEYLFEGTAKFKKEAFEKMDTWSF